ncbi:hypothetical protein [Lysinibacillus sp. FW12]|uniref:hypothetical protein n=1 Tax=Lysinibacillus sp. FW12 TaxID=3096079 RepID=UPI003D72DBEC
MAFKTLEITLLIPFQTARTRPEILENKLSRKEAIPLQTLVKTVLIPVRIVLKNVFIPFQTVSIDVFMPLKILLTTVLIVAKVLVKMPLIAVHMPCKNVLAVEPNAFNGPSNLPIN